MNEQGTFIATLLDASSKAYAAGAVLRMQESGAEGEEFVQNWGFRTLVEETEARLHCLSEALACGCPEVFQQQSAWLSVTHAARNVPARLQQLILSCLKEELESGLPEKDAGFAVSYVDRTLESIAKVNEDPVEESECQTPHDLLARQFLLAVLEARSDDAEKMVLEALESGVCLEDLHHYVLTRAQREVGEMWQRGELHIASEHLGSRIVENVLSRLRGQMKRNESCGRTILLASVTGNLHDIGLRIVADQFEQRGWRTLFLGANMPNADLIAAAEEYNPDLVALSAGLGIHLRATSGAIRGLKDEKPALPVIVGGGPFSAIPELWKTVGADGCARTAAQAVELGFNLSATAAS